MFEAYTRTLFHEDLTKARIELYIHEATKYEAAEEDETKEIKTGVRAWSIVTGSDAVEIEYELVTLMDEPLDEYGEYLVLYYENGEKDIFRNSHVSMFII